jgi:Tripartite tricarboxylate transporter family receptor
MRKAQRSAVCETVEAIDLWFADRKSLVDIRAGNLIALGVTTKKRSSLLPDVPTIAESGGEWWTEWVLDCIEYKGKDHYLYTAYNNCGRTSFALS